MIFHVLIAFAMAGLTWTLGWWGIVVGAAILGYVFRTENGRAWRVALAAVEGWAILLLIDAIAGPLVHVGSTLQGVMSIPWPALMLVTLLFPALLAWSAAAVTSELAKLMTRSSAPKAASR
jgi:hypothetical protein